MAVDQPTIAVLAGMTETGLALQDHFVATIVQSHLCVTVAQYADFVIAGDSVEGRDQRLVRDGDPVWG